MNENGDQIEMMVTRKNSHTAKRTRMFMVAAVLAVAFALAGYMFFAPLRVFVRQIADADRLVVTLTLNDPPPVSVTITGQDLARIIRMVSSAHRDRKDYQCGSVANVKFLKDTEILGRMTICSQLMWIDHGQYRDDTGLLDKLVVIQILEAKREWESKQQPGIK